MLCSRLAPPLCPQSGGPPACLRACEPQTPFSSGSLCCCPVCFTNRCRLVVQARLHHQRPQRAVRHRLPRARRGGAPDGRHLPRPRLRILRWVGGWLWVAGFVWLLGSFLGLACECCCLAGCIPAHLLSTEKLNTQHSTPPPPVPFLPTLPQALATRSSAARCRLTTARAGGWPRRRTTRPPTSTASTGRGCGGAWMCPSVSVWKAGWEKAAVGGSRGAGAGLLCGWLW